MTLNVKEALGQDGLVVNSGWVDIKVTRKPGRAPVKWQGVDQGTGHLKNIARGDECEELRPKRSRVIDRKAICIEVRNQDDGHCVYNLRNECRSVVA